MLNASLGRGRRAGAKKRGAYGVRKRRLKSERRWLSASGSTILTHPCVKMGNHLASLDCGASMRLCRAWKERATVAKESIRLGRLKKMTCYHPNIRIEDTSRWEKAKDGHRYHPAIIRKADDLSEDGKMENIKDGPLLFKYKKQLIPCGKCIGCRLDKSRDWANRGYLEAKKSDHNYFVTLTYDDDHIHFMDYMEDRDGITWENENGEIGCLNKADTTLFIRNIKQYMSRKYQNNNIKYMLCGEYGGKTQRPHSHVIFFNLQLPQETFYKPRIIQNEIYYQNEIIERFWKKGISNISKANWQTIAYVARYITKKINGEGSEELYARNGMIKEYFHMSKGIGKDYYLQNKDKIYENDEIIIHNGKGAHKVKPPKYFDNLLKKEDENRFKKIRAKRSYYAEHAQKIDDTTSDKTRLQRLADHEEYKQDSIKALKRRLET